MLIGYARTSTLDQAAGLDAQMRDLKALGAEKIFAEQVSSVADRPQLEAAIEFLRDGDTLAVIKLDRLARSVPDMWRTIERIQARGASLRIENLNLDTSTATGNLMLSVLGGVAAFEREMMLERQREGIAKAKAEGKYRGRAPTARARSAEIEALKAQGVGVSEIARRLGIGKASVSRIIAAGAIGGNV